MASHGIGKNSKVILYVGRLVDARKNISTLIKAFRKIGDPEFRLVIVGGGGKSLDLYRQLVEGDKRITLLETAPSSIVPYYYTMAGLYVLPSWWEGFNATLIEAATFGVPLLLSTKSINEDIVERFGKQLCLFEPGDVNELATKMKRCFNDKRLRAKLKTFSKEIAFEYSKKKQIDGYADALKRLVEKGRLD